MNSTKDNIRIKIVSAFSIVLIISSLILAFGGYIIQNKYLANVIENKTLEVDKLFADLLENESKSMTAQLQFIANNQGLINAWQSRDRAELNDRASSIFQRISTDFNVTHFYFIEPDRTCFLRVHSPVRFGDEITRYTMNETFVNSRISSGIELGPLGTFTLRVVYPWVNDGKLIGYLELGEEIEHLTPRLKVISGLDLIFTIDKSNIIKEDWEFGIKMLGKDANWDEFAELVIIDKTINSLPSTLKRIVQQNHLHTISRNISLRDRFLSIYSHPLQDVSGRQVGNVITIYDITNITLEIRKIIVLLVMAMLSIWLLIWVFYYIYSGRIAKQVLAYRNNLEDLVEERTRELHNAMDEVKVLSGFIPICASCKKIRDDEGFWDQIESYITEHSEAKFTHSICPECAKKLYPDIVGENGNIKK